MVWLGINYSRIWPYTLEKYLTFGKYLNLLGGLLIAINCYYYNAIPPFVTNLLWSVIATLTIYKSRHKKKYCNKNQCLT